MNVVLVLVAVGGIWGVLALASLFVEWRDRRRTLHAAEKARRDAEDAYFEHSIRCAAIAGMSWPPAREQ